MTELRMTLPHLHRAQRQVADSDARYRVIDAGRRFGKTRLGSLLCVVEGIEGRRAWWVAPTYPMAAVGWRGIKQLARQVPGAIPREMNRMITFASGGTVQVRSADKPESLRGEGLDLVVVDEVAHMPKWEEVWGQSLRPALSDRQGKAFFISTPKGYNHFWELYRTAEESDDGSWQAWQFPTSSNPYIASEEIEAAKKDLPALVFRQEYGAEFVQLAGALFKREWFGVLDSMPRMQRSVRYWDLAVSTKQTADYTVGARVGHGFDGGIMIEDVVRGRWEWPDALRIILATAQSDGPGVTQGVEDVGVQKGMYQSLMREPGAVNLAFRPMTVNKDKMIRANPWLARAEQGKVSLLRAAWNAAWLDEVCAFPEAAHDDQVDAVSGAFELLALGQMRMADMPQAEEVVSKWVLQ